MERHAPDTVTPKRPKPLVIALHGAVVNSATWLPLMRDLGDAADVTAFDLPGHGVNSEQPFTLAAALTAIDEAIPASEPQRTVILVGDSLGGYLAILAAAVAGNRVGGIVVAGASFPLNGAGGVLARATDIPPALVTQLFGDEPLKRLCTGLLHRMTDEATAQAVLARGLALQTRAQSLHELQAVDIFAKVSECTGSVYVVNGAWDLPTRWFTRALAGRAQDGFATIISGAGHACALSHAHAFTDVVRSAIVHVEHQQLRSQQAS